MNNSDDHELIASIAPDVTKCLVRRNFFDKLDDLLSPKNDSSQGERCHGDFRLSKTVLLASGFEQAELDDIFGVLRSKGGFCDCEILYNVAETSRLKAKYWRNKVDQPQNSIKHGDS